uniref:Class I SAM-dependent methyltransferase n=1 Tax=Parascaris univalens TaxID=6257 RepID=A0A915C7C4_PARUN
MVYSFREFAEEIIQRKTVYNQLREVKPSFHSFGSRKDIFEYILQRYFMPLRFDKPIRIIEVGAYKGNFTNDMAISCRDFKLRCIIIAIDIWQYVDWMRGYGDPEESSDQIFFEQYLSNIVYFNNSDVVTPYRVTSRDAYVAFKCAGVKADLIYIDADHSFQSVYDDMKMFYDLLDDNGIMFGDDFWFPAVKKAVDAFAKLQWGSLIDISHMSARTWLVEHTRLATELLHD